MLLNPRAAALPLCLCLALALPACDRGRAERGREDKSASFISFENEPAAREQRLARAGRKAADPRAEPTYRQQREARARIRAIKQNHDEMNAIGATALLTNEGASSMAGGVRFVAATGALTLRIDAADRLNLVDGVPHALTLIVYHAADRTAFDQLAGNGQGMLRLLEGEPFDRSVCGVRRLDIQPGQKSVLTLDRPENGRYVALVAGYHLPNGTGGVEVRPYPIGQFVKETSTMIWKGRTLMFTPERLDLYVKLGEDSMQASVLPISRDNYLESVKLDPYEYAWSR